MALRRLLCRLFGCRWVVIPVNPGDNRVVCPRCGEMTTAYQWGQKYKGR